MGLVEFWQSLAVELRVFLISMLPIVELKGAILLGASEQLPIVTNFLLSWIGSTLPMPFILWFLRPILQWMKKQRPFEKLANWFERHSLKKGKNIIKYEYLGLFIFVAIPLPGTGVWMGSGIAALLNLRMKYAMPVVLLGNAVAGLLMLALGIVVF